MMAGHPGERVRRWVRRRLSPVGLILQYHRVIAAPTDPHILCVTPDHFEAHLQVVRQCGQPVSLRQLVQSLRSGRLIERAIVVTFDDGYADNLHYARPLLARYAVPATVFVSTAYIDHPREFWWDELERLVLTPGTLPETVALQIDGARHAWRLGERACYSEAEWRQRQDWDLARPDDPTERHALFRGLYGVLHPLDNQQREAALDQLAALAQQPQRRRATHRMLTAREVVELAADGLVEIGAHTHTHPALAALPEEAQRAEISDSKTILEELLGAPVTSFAYPHGAASRATRQAVRDAGYRCACSNVRDNVWRGSDLFQLPRIRVKDWDGETFARWLDGWWRA